MDIITILQTIQPYLPTIFLTFCVGTIYGMWKGFVAFKQHQVKKYSIAHMRKMAGIATDTDAKTLKKNPPKWRCKYKKRFEWKEFIKKFDIRDDVKKMNPFRVIRELEKLKKEEDYLSNRINSLKWSLNDQIDKRIEESKKPKEDKEDFVRPRPTRKEIGEKQLTSLIPRSTSSCFE